MHLYEKLKRVMEESENDDPQTVCSKFKLSKADYKIATKEIKITPKYLVPYKKAKQ